MVSTPVLNHGSESPRDEELDGQENVDEVAGLNLLCSAEQLEQLLCGSSRIFEPVSITTVLVRQVRWFMGDKSEGSLQCLWRSAD